MFGYTKLNRYWTFNMLICIVNFQEQRYFPKSFDHGPGFLSIQYLVGLMFQGTIFEMLVLSLRDKSMD